MPGHGTLEDPHGLGIKPPNRRKRPKPKVGQVNTKPASAKKPPKPRVTKAAKPRQARART